MTSSLRERRRTMLRDEILAAAHQLLTEKGYSAMSMDELAARAGVSKPTVYSHFSAKEELVVAMASGLMQRLRGELAASDAPTSPLEQLCELLHSVVRIQLELRADAMRLWMPDFVTILETHPETREQIVQIDTAVVGLINAAIAVGEIPSDADPSSVSRAYYALICAPNVGRLSALGRPDPETLADTVVRCFRSGLANG
ncbi:MAG: TetR/AcrR family transcriptional regulator [Oscillochloris sp.]|nr:TetR/AcrR family transcriptional regulator [Oscillochloris sp.]